MTHLWAPWRSAYITEKKDRQRCIFCEAGTGSDDLSTLVVHRGRHNFVILNRYPYTSGHFMIAPYDHVSRLGQLSEASSHEITLLARLAEEVLQNVYNPDGLNIGLNLGRAAGAGIEQHLHLHVVPRWEGDANFMTSVGQTRVMPESLEQTYTKLKRAFAEY